MVESHDCHTGAAESSLLHIKAWKAVHNKGFSQTQDVCAVTPISRRFDESKCFICLTSALNNRLLSRITPSSGGVLLTLIVLTPMVKEGNYLLSLDHM